MISIDRYIKELDIEEDLESLETQEKQKELFLEYVVKKDNFIEYRENLYQEFLKGKAISGKDGLRKKLGAIDQEYFGRAYLGHYFTRDSPKFHKELNEIWTKGVLKDLNPIENKNKNKLSKLKGCKRGIAAPRGHAKSTTFTFKNTTHAVLYEYKHFILILSDSSEQAEGFLQDIKIEFEENRFILEDFGLLKDKKKKWTDSSFTTATNIKVEAIGSGKKVRGRKHRNWRPDLIVLDDIENDENVNTPEQRKKLANWYYKAVSKAGDSYTDIVYIGTMLHYDSLLAKVLNNPEYHCVKYRGVISFSSSEDLWNVWETIYTDLENEERQEEAKQFFEDNKQEMLEGTQVLWGEKLSYYDLMVIRISEGEASFNSEIQNEPVDPENCTFNEEWIDYYEEELIDFSDPDFIFVGANDPSLGKNQRSDTSSIIALAKNIKTGYMYVIEASIERRKPDVIIEDTIEMSKRFKMDYKKSFIKFGVETVQFQHFFKDIMAERSRKAGEMLPIEEIHSLQNKQLRIESLQPFVKNKYIKFNKKHKTLLKQMTEYPMGRNDDGPDGLEMAVRLALQINGNTKTDYKSVISRVLNFKKGAY